MSVAPIRRAIGNCQRAVLVVRASQPVSRRLETAVDYSAEQKCLTMYMFVVHPPRSQQRRAPGLKSGGRRTGGGGGGGGVGGVRAHTSHSISMRAQLLLGWVTQRVQR